MNMHEPTPAILTANAVARDNIGLSGVGRGGADSSSAGKTGAWRRRRMELERYGLRHSFSGSAARGRLHVLSRGGYRRRQRARRGCFNHGGRLSACGHWHYCLVGCAFFCTGCWNAPNRWMAKLDRRIAQRMANRQDYARHLIGVETAEFAADPEDFHRVDKLDLVAFGDTILFQPALAGVE